MNWLTWSLLSAVFAALTAILVKIGIAADLAASPSPDAAVMARLVRGSGPPSHAH